MQEIGAYASRGEKTKWRPAAVTMATNKWIGKTGYLVRSRANWTFRDTSSCWSPETGRRTKDARTSSRPSPPCSHTCHSYTGRDLQRKQEDTRRAGESNQAEDVHMEADRAGSERAKTKIFLIYLTHFFVLAKC